MGQLTAGEGLLAREVLSEQQRACDAGAHRCEELQYGRVRHGEVLQGEVVAG